MATLDNGRASPVLIKLHSNGLDFVMQLSDRITSKFCNSTSCDILQEIVCHISLGDVQLNVACNTPV